MLKVNKLLIILANIGIFIGITSFSNFSLAMERDPVDFLAKDRELDLQELSRKVKYSFNDFKLAKPENKDKAIIKFINKILLSDAFFGLMEHNPDKLKPYGVKDLNNLSRLINNLIDDDAKVDESLIRAAIDLDTIEALVKNNDEENNFNRLFRADNFLKTIKKVLAKTSLTNKDLIEMLNWQALLAEMDEEEKGNFLKALEELKQETPHPSIPKGKLQNLILKSLAYLNINRLDDDKIWQATGVTAAVGITGALWLLGHTFFHNYVESLEPTGALAISLGAGTALATALGYYWLNNSPNVQINVVTKKIKR